MSTHPTHRPVVPKRCPRRYKAHKRSVRAQIAAPRWSGRYELPRRPPIGGEGGGLQEADQRRRGRSRRRCHAQEAPPCCVRGRCGVLGTRRWSGNERARSCRRPASATQGRWPRAARAGAPATASGWQRQRLGPAWRARRHSGSSSGRGSATDGHTAALCSGGGGAHARPHQRRLAGRWRWRRRRVFGGRARRRNTCDARQPARRDALCAGLPGALRMGGGDTCMRPAAATRMCSLALRGPPVGSATPRRTSTCTHGGCALTPRLHAHRSAPAARI